jgi:hypothetical protein
MTTLQEAVVFDLPSGSLENLDFTIVVFHREDVFELHLTDLRLQPIEPDFPKGHGQSSQVLCSADSVRIVQVIRELRYAAKPLTVARSFATDCNCDGPGKPIHLDRMTPTV